ncbi:hypothetical protein PBY51_006562 [Eleginops maclovinus]|uniref:Uncharacterized protein n=1 Tax=Eleginops maclovinus TaxID=56733 RepID=A0AAN8A4U2_ELEMC|nr:hypothetical protein PBY51_006562 [Eleginops maclovinus]
MSHMFMCTFAVIRGYKAQQQSDRRSFRRSGVSGNKQRSLVPSQTVSPSSGDEGALQQHPSSQEFKLNLYVHVCSSSYSHHCLLAL